MENQAFPVEKVKAFPLVFFSQGHVGSIPITRSNLVNHTKPSTSFAAVSPRLQCITVGHNAKDTMPKKQQKQQPKEAELTEVIKFDGIHIDTLCKNGKGKFYLVNSRDPSWKPEPVTPRDAALWAVARLEVADTWTGETSDILTALTRRGQ